MMNHAGFRPLGLMLTALLLTTVVAAAPPAVPSPPAAAATAPTATGTEADAAQTASAPSADTHGEDWGSGGASNEDADRVDSNEHGNSDDPDDPDDHGHDSSRKHRHPGARHESALVNIFDDSVLEAGREADSVVSVFGNTRVEGTVHDSAVAVFGENHIDGKVQGDAVAVFGNVYLGPHAEVDGDIVTVAGEVRRDPAAIVHGDSSSIFAHDFSRASALRTWFEKCFLYGRPLSLAPGLGWTWGLALTFLALYLVIAAVFRQGVEQCVATFESHPGRSVLAALLAALLTPVLIVLLCITVIGIAAIPFTVIGLFCVALFGKTVILAWLGGKLLSVRGASAAGAAAALPATHPALTVLLGGLLALGFYLVPFFGFVAYNLLGFFGFGAVIYTVIQRMQARHAAKTGAGDGATRDTAAAGATGVGMAGVGTAALGTAGVGTAPAVTADLPRAGFWLRMAALLLDVLLVGVVGSILWVSHVFLVILATYGAAMWKLRGCTVGGIVFDLRVVRVDGRPMDWETSIVRALSCFLSLAVAGLGFLWIAFDGANQAWHDKIAGTVVVRVPKPLARVPDGA
jgi:uncharacterized RDD family membrane protein YckC